MGIAALIQGVRDVVLRRGADIAPLAVLHRTGVDVVSLGAGDGTNPTISSWAWANFLPNPQVEGVVEATGVRVQNLMPGAGAAKFVQIEVVQTTPVASYPNGTPQAGAWSVVLRPYYWSSAAQAWLRDQATITLSGSTRRLKEIFTLQCDGRPFYLAVESVSGMVATSVVDIYGEVL